MFKRNSFFIVLFITTVPLYVFSQTAHEKTFNAGLVLTLPPNEHIITPDKIIGMMETREWKSPADGEQVKSNGKLIGTWKAISADSVGWFRDSALRNAYMYVSYQSQRDEIVLLEAMGNEMVYVNGSARTGNPYRSKDAYEDWDTKFDYCLLPIQLHKGKNELLFRCDRGLLKAKIHSGQHGLFLSEKDVTAPDLQLNRASDAFGAILIINSTERSYNNLYIKTWSDTSEPTYYPVNKINPLSVYKAPFRFALEAIKNPAKVKLSLALFERSTGANEHILSSAAIELKVVDEHAVRKETFVSAIDGSVQYIGVKPPLISDGKSALFLSLHGAGVEAINQANSYSAKNWGYIVAPTNRRPYGYHWENWGRLDALEALALAKKKFEIDESRVYLTGHSMGGHGAWHLALNYPDQFAAVGPSAGWISIWSYRIRPQRTVTEVGKMLLRSAGQSDTYAFARNLKSIGLYILHGSMDDNVPPEQARSMVDTLSSFHKDFIYHEEPGVGHWWDHSDEEGADCVDWKPMFDFFSHHAVPGKGRTTTIDFLTANLAIASKNYWVEIINQQEQQKLSKISVRVESSRRRFIGTTENITALVVDAGMLSGDQAVSVELDNQKISEIPLPGDKMLYLRKEYNKWGLSRKFSAAHKNPVRCGTLREALNHRVVFIYGTHGSEEENAWAYEKTRYDAEQLWYRGNGSVEVIRDNEFDPAKYKDRNVMLFGNSRTNSAWNILLDDSPVQVGRNKITLGTKEYAGNDLACLMIRPRKDSEVASVGVVSGTGIKGMRLANFASYHNPYLSFPDIVIYDSKIMQSDEEGVKLTGFFGNDWSVESGEFVRR